MSRAFVKEQDSDAVEVLPDRPISPYPNDVTERGLALIETALMAARSAFASAQATGDRAAINRAGRDLRYWTSRHASARVVDSPGTTNEVRFGSQVTIVRDDGREQIFRIVGEDEADPPRGTISHASPLARALLGKTVGDVVTAGRGEAQIKSLS